MRPHTSHHIMYIYLHIDQTGLHFDIFDSCTFSVILNPELILKYRYMLFLFVQSTTFPKEHALWMALLYFPYLFIPPAPLPPPPDQEVNRGRLCYHTLLLVWGTKRYRCTFFFFFAYFQISTQPKTHTICLFLYVFRLLSFAFAGLV